MSIKELAAYAKTPEGEAALIQYKRENLIGQYGIDYGIKELALVAKAHPEAFPSTQPSPKPTRETFLPGPIRQLIQREQIQEREQEVVAYERQYGWTPEKVKAMSHEEAWVTSTYLQKMREGKASEVAWKETEALWQTFYLPQKQQTEWEQGTIAGRTFWSAQYAKKTWGLPGQALGTYLEWGSGAFGVFESWVPLVKFDYPRPPATPIGALISTGFGTEQQGYLTPSKEWKFEAEHPAYLVGGITGTYLEALGLGYGASKAFQGLKKVVPQAIQQPFYRAKEAIRFSTPAKLLHEAKLWIMKKVPVYKLYEPFKKEIARGEIALPTFERFGLKELEVEALAWKILSTPRTAGVWIAHMASEAGGKSSWSYLMKGSTGWVVKEATFTPLISQAQVTRMGIQPYIPKMTAQSFTGQGLSRIMGFGATVVPLLRQPKRLMPKKWIPTFTYEREKLRPQTLLDIMPKQKQRKIPVVALKPREELAQIQRVIPRLIPQQKQRIVQLPRYDFPTPQELKTVPSFPTWPLGGGSGSGGRGSDRLFGRWYRKTQAIKTPQQMMETFFGKPKKPRRRHK